LLEHRWWCGGTSLIQTPKWRPPNSNHTACLIPNDFLPFCFLLAFQDARQKEILDAETAAVAKIESEIRAQAEAESAVNFI